MVKGVTRQVILVRTPEAGLFEQAIFLVRSDAAEKGGLSEQDVLRQAEQAARHYAVQRTHTEHPNLHRVLLLLAGAAAVGLAWLICAIL